MPRFRSTCYSCALSICVRRSVTLWRKSTVWRQAYHLKQTKQEWRGKICQPQPSCKHYTIFSTQAPRKWKVHTAAVIIKSHKKGIRVLEIENACNVAEFSRQRASITASVRAAKILCRGGKDPIRLILKRITLYRYYYKIGHFFKMGQIWRRLLPLQGTRARERYRGILT